MDLPDILARGERARLFPVLADTSKEGRTLSIFLACLANVREFGAAMLASLDVRTGVRTRIETYTEVVLKKGCDKKHRPDGLIVVKTGSKTWTALVEAKVGNSDLTPEQVESYLDLAKLNGVDALITLSNQFACLPTHHPIMLSAASRRKAASYHWSWMYVVTQASLLISNDQIADADQRVILNEMNRFLVHPSAGVKGFDQMPAAWSDIVARVQTGAKLAVSSGEVRDVIGAWHQELRDLSLILSRKLSIEVSTHISRAHASDPAARLKSAIADLVSSEALEAAFLVPDAAAPLEICCDLNKRSVSVSMRVKAPADRKTTKSRLSWLLRQLSKADPANVFVRLYWPGRAAQTQYSLAQLRDPEHVAGLDRSGMVPHTLEVVLIRDLGARFGQRKNFIAELEATVPHFYEQAGQYLKAWVASAPRVKDTPVTIEALEDQAEAVAEEREPIA